MRSEKWRQWTGLEGLQKRQERYHLTLLAFSPSYLALDYHSYSASPKLTCSLCTDALRSAIPEFSHSVLNSSWPSYQIQLKAAGTAAQQKGQAKYSHVVVLQWTRWKQWLGNVFVLEPMQTCCMMVLMFLLMWTADSLDCFEWEQCLWWQCCNCWNCTRICVISEWPTMTFQANIQIREEIIFPWKAYSVKEKLCIWTSSSSSWAHIKKL